MDIPQELVALLLIAGTVELITRIRAKDLWVVATIVSAALVGLLLGLFKFYVPDPITGIAFGLTASGLVTVIGAVKSVATTRSATNVK